jgi:hypothetical protein
MRFKNTRVCVPHLLVLLTLFIWVLLPLLLLQQLPK